jgi:hypothetical protein
MKIQRRNTFEILQSNTGRGDFLSGLTAIAFGIWILVETSTSFNVAVSSRIGGGIDAAGYPRLLAIICVGLGASLILKVFFTERLPEENSDTALPNYGRAFSAFIILLIYTKVLPLLGFWLATFLAVVILLYAAGMRQKLNLGISAGGITLAIWLGFSLGADILLPPGLLVQMVFP